jgi:hypothetical protein
MNGWLDVKAETTNAYDNENSLPDIEIHFSW